MIVLVGGVGELFQGDLDLGRIAVDRLREAPLGNGVLVEELHYGAIAVAQRLQELRPSALVLLGARIQGRPPGTVARRRVGSDSPSPEDVQRAVEHAITGYVDLDLIVDVCSGLGALPRRTTVVEVEPACCDPGDELSAPVRSALPVALALVRAEVRRVPLLELTDRLHPLSGDRLGPAPAAATLRRLLGELASLDQHGRWGSAFSMRDTLRCQIAEGGTGEGMDHLDWGLWWALIEELDRLEQVEASV